MSTGGYKMRVPAATYFVTFAVAGWVDVFTRPMYNDLLLDSVRYYQEHRGLVVNAWCLMTNHIHLIYSARQKDPGAILRDLKKYTSNQIVKAIETNGHESRREWMLSIFKEAGAKNTRNTNHQFWRQDNHPVELYSPAFIIQKMDYVHSNPVAAGLVDRPEHYRYSSARDYLDHKKCGLLDIAFL